MNTPVLISTFLAASIEVIEIVAIVVAVGATRQWRGALAGTLAGLLVLAVLIAALGTALQQVPLSPIRVVVGALLLTFGLQWVRKGVLSVSRYGWTTGIGEQQVEEDVGDGFDWTGFLLAFRGVSLEGLEVAVIVVAFGAADHAIASAAIGAAASVLLIGALGAASYRLVARIPRRALQLFVGALLTTFGTFWAVEGLGADWPGGDLALLWLGALYIAAALVLVRAVERDGRLTVRMRAATHQFHRDLPSSSIWGFEGTVPGPTIETERGRPVTIEWRNELQGPFPVVDTIAPRPTDANGVPVQCFPGLSGGEPNRHAAGLTGNTVVHLPGGLTPASSDGWAENLFAPGQPAVFHYPMDQRAALLWYHDHVMGITKLDVYAGLAGLWIVRDDRERELGLPEGPPFEAPLLIQDRNFNLDEQGRLTGRLLHKTDPDVMEAFPPFTVVNGKVWPVLEVQPATYRFRVLNGSNARTYRLVLLRDGAPEFERITQIGTDHGLLRTPVPVPADGLVLASAERADLLIDFSDLAPGSELTVLNTAAAPFDGSAFPAADAESAADLDGLLPYPQVLRFRVARAPGTRVSIP